MNKALMYVAADGSYGDATNLLIVDATDFIGADYEALDGVDDGERQEEAQEIAHYRMTDPITWVWMTSIEAAQMLDTLTNVIELLIEEGRPGLAEEIGDVRDVLNRLTDGYTR